jgi:hypothetical protein
MNLFTNKPLSQQCPEQMQQVFSQLPLMSQLQGLTALLGNTDRADIRQKLAQEILPRLRSLKAPEDRILAATDISKRLRTLGNSRDDAALCNIHLELLEVVFHDRDRWTPKQHAAGLDLKLKLPSLAAA